jgi:hypothetical protein
VLRPARASLAGSRLAAQQQRLSASQQQQLAKQQHLLGRQQHQGQGRSSRLLVLLARLARA